MQLFHASMAQAAIAASSSVDNVDPGTVTRETRVNVAVQNTFCCFVHAKSPLPARSASAPPSLRKHYITPPAERRAMPSRSALRAQSPLAPQVQGGSSSSSGSAVSEEDGEEVVVVVGASVLRPRSSDGRWKPQSESPTPSSDTVRLTQLLSLRSAGLQSLGSLRHAAGDCRPCLFHGRRKTGSGVMECWKGALCERCHEGGHEDAPRRSSRAGRLADLRGAQRRGVAGASQGQRGKADAQRRG